MKLTEPEYDKLKENLKILASMFNDQVKRIPKSRATEIDNSFVKLIGEKYLTPTGLLDLLEDYEILTEKDCTCAAPCTATCVSPCASRCNASTYSICSGQEM